MSRRPALHALQQLTSLRWAIRPDALERMVAIAERDLAPLLAAGGDGAELDAVAEKLRPRRALFSAPAVAHPNASTLAMRDGVAILPIVGPLCRYASWIQEVCGLTSYQIAAEDFRIALEDPSVRAILLHLDSPGGEVNGCSELASLIYGARGTKPIVAMVSDGAASAAYWIAAAADEIVVTAAAYVGSIGVYCEVVDYSEMEAAVGIRRHRVVSSQSPNKVPDPADPAGKAVIQREMTEFADAFIAQAADGRGMSPDALIAAGDGGAVFIGRFAVERGLADRVSTTEAVLAELAAREFTPPATARATRARPPIAANQEHLMAKTRTAAAEDGADGNTPPTTTYRIGDRVRVGAGKEHDEMTRDKAGVVRVIATPALGIEFDGMDGVHKWYVDEEVTPDAEGASAPPAEEEEMPMAAGRSITTIAQLAHAHPALVAQVRLEATTAERDRVLELAALDPRTLAPSLRAAIANGSTPGAAAIVLLEASRTPGAATLAAMAAAEQSLTPPAPMPTGTDAAPSAAKQITSLLDEVSGRGRARRASTN